MLCYRLAVLAVVLSLCAVPSALAKVPPRVNVTQYPDAVVVYVHDLDLLRAAHSALTAEVRLAGVERTYRIDLAAPYQTPAIVIAKQGGAPCAQVSVTIRSGAVDLFRKDLPAGPVVKVTPRVPLTETKAFIEPGRHMGAAPEIVQPDLAALPSLALPEAERRVAMDSIAAKVESDINFPLISAKNNCAISRQTAHPDDPSRRSCYVPLKSQLYDPETGNPSGVRHYLAEVPLQSQWLEGTEDTVLRLGVNDIRLHTTTRRWPPDKPRAPMITGQGAGGLGQLVGGMAVNDDGNIYYSSSVPSSVVRFNVAKAEFEAPPINVFSEMNKFLPRKESMPAEYRGVGSRWDWYVYVATGGGRLFVMPVRYAHYRTLYANGVFSFPLEHWYDAEKFRAGMHFVAGSWPASQCALYDKWPVKGQAARKIAPGFYHESKFYLRNYSGSSGGPWCIELNADGSSKSVRVIKGDEYQSAWKKPRPKHAVAAGGLLNWWDYGALKTSRAQMSQALTGTRDAKAKGALTIYYDVIAAMRAAPEQHAEVLASLSGPSLAPCYMAVAIPDRPGHILGVGEYGYYLADLDVSAAGSGVVPKRYLQLDLGEAKTRLPVRVGLGPYGRLWWQDGDKRYLIMPGYTGIASLLYSVGGKPLDRHDSIALHLSSRSLDGAQPGGVKRVRYPQAGIDGRVYLTGTHTADRGGTAYSSGLMAFAPGGPGEMLRLSRMNRGSHTYMLRTRVVYQPDGRKVQQFVLCGGSAVKGYILKMNGRDVPRNQEAKVFLYDCAEGGEPRDLLGFSAPVLNGKSGIAGQVFSRDRRYLLTLQHGCLVTFDLAAWRYVDGRKLDAGVWEFSRPDYCFNVAPDDRIFICASTRDAAGATFCEVEVSAAGEISLRPHLTITATDAKALRPLRGGVIVFVPDPKGDGSYDLCLGPGPRTGGTRVWVVPDFLPSRTP